MSTTKRKLPLNKATGIANRFLALIQPHITKAEIAGAIRRQCKEVSEIMIVCVEDAKNPLERLFTKDYPGLSTNGKKFKKFVYPKDDVQIELYIVQNYDYGRMLAVRTGSSAYSHIKLSITINRKGWCTTENGLRRKKQCVKKGAKWILRDHLDEKVIVPPPFNSEADFFEFLSIPWVNPKDRNWKSTHDKYNY